MEICWIRSYEDDSMKQVLVIGYGNSLRSDDCVGLYAVRELQKIMNAPNVEFMEVAQLQPEIAERLSRVDFAVFIDAAMDGISGETKYERLHPTVRAQGLSHSTDPETLLAAALELYGRSPEALLATVTGECFGFGTKLSHEVEVSMRGLAVRVGHLIEEFLREEAVV
jgi:hydrogenase maturation protease